MSDWKNEVKEMDFNRYPKMAKTGTQVFTFKSEGKEVAGDVTGFKGSSIVFVVEQNGSDAELWMGKGAPLLREFLKHSERLTGHTATVKFSGSGLNLRADVTAWK